MLPDGSKLYTENEEDACAFVIDLKNRKRIGKIVTPGAVAGIGLSHDGKTVILVDATKPQIFVVDTATDIITRTIELTGHAKPAQIARFAALGSHARR